MLFLAPFSVAFLKSLIGLMQWATLHTFLARPFIAPLYPLTHHASTFRRFLPRKTLGLLVEACRLSSLRTPIPLLDLANQAGQLPQGTPTFYTDAAFAYKCAGFVSLSSQSSTRLSKSQLWAKDIPEPYCHDQQTAELWALLACMDPLPRFIKGYRSPCNHRF